MILAVIKLTQLKTALLAVIVKMDANSRAALESVRNWDRQGRLQKAEAEASLLRSTNEMLASRLRYYTREVELACCNALVAERYILPQVHRQYRNEVTRLMNEIRAQHPNVQVPESFTDSDPGPNRD